MGRQVNAWADHHGSVRLGTLLPPADILPDLGVDPAQLLAECGVDPKVFEDPDPQILLLLHNRLVALAVARSGCPHIGLLVRYSPAVETALRSFVRYLHTCARREVDARGG